MSLTALASTLAAGFPLRPVFVFPLTQYKRNNTTLLDFLLLEKNSANLLCSSISASSERTLAKPKKSFTFEHPPDQTGKTTCTFKLVLG